MSRVSRLVSAVESKMLWRVIGSVDAVGQGMNHELNDVNPFVLFDHAKPMHKKGTPPFGIHPHHGLHVASLLWEGVLENRVGPEPESTLFGKSDGPAVLSTMAGSGVSHEEKSASDDLLSISQIVWLIPEASRTLPHRSEQLSDANWHQISPGHKILVAVGSILGIDSPIITETPVNLFMGHLDAGSTTEIKTIFGGGFLYCVNGQLTIDETLIVSAHQVAVLTSADGKITISNTSKETVKYVFGNGSRIEEPWVKLLTHNGFLLAANLEAAREQEKIIERVGVEHYGNPN